LSGLVWFDDDVNGKKNDTENVNNVTVYLFDSDGNKIAETKTDEDGKYIFEHLDPQLQYMVVFDKDTLPEGYVVTAKGKGNTDKDSDADTSTAKTDLIDLVPGETTENIDMGIHRIGTTKEKPYLIGTHFWIDNNKDGVYNEGDEAIPGALVELLDEDGNKLYWTNENKTELTTEKTAWSAETRTDAKGSYAFYVPAGTYGVKFNIPEGDRYADYIFDNAEDNADNAKNISTVEKNGFVKEINVGPGYKTAELTVDAGIYCGCDDGTVKSNGGDALSWFGMLMMMVMTLLSGLYFVREETKEEVC